jgi:hypothetical protein
MVCTCVVAVLCPARASLAEVVDPQNADYQQRFRATHHLGDKLSPGYIATLCLFLERLPQDDIARADDLPVLKNNVADALLRQRALPDPLFDVFVAVFADARQGELWREYVVQKVPEFCLRLTDEGRRLKALQFLRERAVDTDYIFAGTAILGLDRVRTAHPDWVSSNEIARLADGILGSPKHALASKISALQVLGANDAARGRQEAARCLKDDSSINLQASALATLGDIGLPGDRELIEPYAQNPDLRLRTAAAAAIARLTARTKQASGP